MSLLQCPGDARARALPAIPVSELPRGVNPHTLRAYGDDLTCLLDFEAEHLGHASLSTTQTYTEIDTGALMAVYKHAHSRAG